MKLQEFIIEISDEIGPLWSTAADLIEGMSKKEFEELIDDMKDCLSAREKQRISNS